MRNKFERLVIAACIGATAGIMFGIALFFAVGGSLQ